MTTVQIKHCDSGRVLYECETPADMAACLQMRHALEKAAAIRADLRRAAAMEGGAA